MNIFNLYYLKLHYKIYFVISIEKIRIKMKPHIVFTIFHKKFNISEKCFFPMPNSKIILKLKQNDLI